MTIYLIQRYHWRCQHVECVSSSFDRAEELVAKLKAADPAGIYGARSVELDDESEMMVAS